MNWNKTALVAILGLVLVIDFLTFHDIFEPHTVKDWLILATSLLAFLYFANVSLRKTK